MKHDERTSAEVRAAQGIGYTVFWFGIFAVLLYRWLYLNQSLAETLDVFMVWILASLVQFFVLASKGIPITYPVVANRKEEVYFLLLAPLAAGFLSAILVYIRGGPNTVRVLGGFAGGGLGSLILFIAYRTIVHSWERRNLK